MSTEVEIAKALAVLADYYGRPVPEVAVKVMVRSLSRHPIEDVRRAINRHIENPDRGRFFPLLADLMAYLGGTDDERARTAWDRAFAAVARHGPYTAVCFDDGLIMHTIRGMGGWARFCEIRLDEVPFRQKEFIERYAAASRTPPQDIPASLPGINTDGAIARIGVFPDDGHALPAPAPDPRFAAMAGALTMEGR